MKRLIMALAIAALGLAFSGSAEAFTQNTTGSMNIGATVLASCTVATTPMDFGSYTGAAFVYTSAPITVNCSNNTSYRVDIDKGLNDRGTNGSLRYLKTGTSPAGSLNSMMYKLYTTSGYLNLWGDNGATYCTTCSPVITGVSGVGTGADQILTVYGFLDRTTNAAGAYSDTVTVTLNY